MAKIVVFASSKGGACKTTSAILFASECARNGVVVTMIDADPNQHSALWFSKKEMPDNMQLIAEVDEDTIDHAIDQACDQSQLVVVDMEGIASSSQGAAIYRSDFVVIPVQPSEPDIKEAVKTIHLLRFMENLAQKKDPSRKLLYSTVVCRTQVAIYSNMQKDMEATFAAEGVPMLGVQLHERMPFKQLISYGGFVHDLPDNKVSGKKQAARNVEEYTRELADHIFDRKAQVEEAAE